MIARALGTALGVIVAGCAAAVHTGQVGETDIGTELPAAQSEPSTQPAPGTISRQNLDELLAGGPAPILSMVVTEPHHDRGRFVGFRIVSFPQGPPRTVDLRPGDVVVAVNGHKIERPEHYFEVFELLKTAGEIRFDLKREGRDETVVHPIVP